MTALFSLVLPILALIGVGRLARHLELLGPHSAQELNVNSNNLRVPSDSSANRSRATSSDVSSRLCYVTRPDCYKCKLPATCL
jgi:hypothetical protein